jgi:hypothetical protein
MPPRWPRYPGNNMTTHTKPIEDNFEAAMLGYVAQGMTIIESLAQYGLEYGTDAPRDVRRQRNAVLVKLLKTEDTLRKMLEGRQ